MEITVEMIYDNPKEYVSGEERSSLKNLKPKKIIYAIAPVFYGSTISCNKVIPGRIIEDEYYAYDPYPDLIRAKGILTFCPDFRIPGYWSRYTSNCVPLFRAFFIPGSNGTYISAEDKVYEKTWKNSFELYMKNFRMFETEEEAKAALRGIIKSSEKELTEAKIKELKIEREKLKEEITRIDFKLDKYNKKLEKIK